MYTYNIAAVLLHVVGTQVEIQYTAVRVHVPCIMSYILCNNKQQQQ